MTVVFFGTLSPAAEDHAVQVAAPVGQACVFCEEDIVEGDRGFMRAVLLADGVEPRVEPTHWECEALTIVGHEFGVCSCTGFASDRAAARELERRMAERGRGLAS